MIRLCPSCDTERPITETFCEGTVDGRICHWDLSAVEIRAPGRTEPPPAAPHALLCPQGHSVAPGDLICPVCEAIVEGPPEAPLPTSLPPEPAAETVVEGWRLTRRLPASSAVRERYIAMDPNERQAVLTLYASGAEPDPAVYDALRKLPRDYVPEIMATGRWQEQAFEVAEELTEGTLATLSLDSGDMNVVRRLVDELGRALHAFAEAGLRHRDLRPEAILVRSREPLDLVIGSFGSARLSEFDLDIVSPLETTRYTAPEAVAGGVAAASDWWSLGIILLEHVTRGACFEGINEQAFLIHVLTNGAPIPAGLDPSLDLLLRGLLARDRRERWQWNEVRAWLAGEPVAAPAAAASPGDSVAGPAITLSGKAFRTPTAFALAAAEAAHWEEAREHLVRGVIATWAADAGLAREIQATLRQINHLQEASDDLRLSLALKVLNPALPLIVRGNILTPGWLLDHPADGYDIVTGPVPDFLRKLDAEPWLSRLKARAAAVRARAQQLEISVAEDELRVQLLSTSMARLAALWEERRRLLPDAEHSGLASLMDRRQTAEEDLILLLAASIEQFRSADEIVEEAAAQARRAGIATFEPTAARAQLTWPRRDIYQTLDTRVENFARSGIVMADEWADQLRLDRLLPLGRALALLAIPAESWKPLPKQGYVSTLLDFFAKRIVGGVLRGPLARMTIGRTTARVDLTELGTGRIPAVDILAQLLSRTANTINLDPAAFAENEPLERRLRSLHSHALLYRRDTGIDGLYLGFPFLLMRDTRGNTLPRVAPVLLWPIRINPQVGNRGHVAIAFGHEHDSDREADQVILNPAFEGLIGLAAVREWEEARRQLLTRSTISTTDVMQAFELLATLRGSALVTLPGKDAKPKLYEKELVPSAALFHLTFMGQAIVKDLEFIKNRQPNGTGLETALRLTELTSATTPVQVPRELDRYFTAASDPSQEAAVLEARAAPGLVVEGPPGTGKSQTIVNMVADAIGRQKTLLVICQKQAALDVVRKRLSKEGLDARVVIVTDMTRDRAPIIKAIRDQVQALHDRLPGDVPGWRRDRERLAAQIERLEGELNQHHVALHQRVDQRTGLTYRTLLGELVTLQSGAPQPINLPMLRSHLAPLGPADVTTLEERCGPLSAYWLPARFEASPLIAVKAFSPDAGTIELLIDALKTFAAAETHREQFNAKGNVFFDVDAAAPLRNWLQEYESDLRSLSATLRANLGRWIPLFRPRGGGAPGVELLLTLADLSRQLQNLDDSAHMPAAAPQLRNTSPELLDEIVGLARSLLKPRSWMGWLNPTPWFRRRRLSRLIAQLHITADLTLESLVRVGQLEQTLRPLRNRFLAAIDKLGGRQPDPDLAPTAIARLVTNVHSILSQAADMIEGIDTCPVSAEAEKAVRSGTPEALETFCETAHYTVKRREGYENSCAVLDGLTLYMEGAWILARRTAIDAGESNVDAVDTIFGALPTLSAYQEFRMRASRLGALEMLVFKTLRAKEAELQLIATADLDQCVRRTISREARLAWKMRIESEDPSVRLDASEISAKIEALAQADSDIRRCNRDLLTDGIDINRVRPPRDWDAITRLTGPRSQRLRGFIEHAGELGLMALRPVWLMTPDVASRILQPKPGMFDTVIYDEASQMPVEYALPTLFRGKIVVVSGDEKQMPPTSFFTSKVENDEAALFDGEEPDDDATEQERETFAETWNRREIKDCPDLLHLARVALPTKMLQVHYRSAYRELIAFSNASFYGDRLSIPVRHPDEVVRQLQPIEVVRSDGTYTSQTNPKEAQDVVSYLAKIWQSRTPPSVGIVTFNRKQADLIEEELEKYAEGDTAFRQALTREKERLEDGEDMGFFVKNVENVQGDERDVVIFSSTFGPNAQKTFRRSFGVLGQAGGERRLNVAVTRARKKVVMVTSMPIAEVSDMLTTRKRPTVPRDYLQAYLEYARMVSDGDMEDGRALLSRMITERAPMSGPSARDADGFVCAVESFLCDLGWKPTPAKDGAFGLDFAIEDPRTGLYGVGIECDAPRHRILTTARAREVWRPHVLKQAIPHVHRVSSYGWVHAGDAERGRLKSAVEYALRSEGGRS